MFRVVSCASWGGAYNDARVDLLSIVGTAAKKRAGSCSPWIPTALCVVGFRTLSSMWKPTSLHWLEPRTLWVPTAMSSVRSRALTVQTVMGTVVSHGLWDLAVLSA